MFVEVEKDSRGTVITIGSDYKEDIANLVKVLRLSDIPQFEAIAEIIKEKVETP